MFAAAFHRFHYFTFKLPAGFLPQIQLSAQFITAYPFLARYNHKNNVECLTQWKLYFMEQAMGGNRLCIFTFAAATGAWLFTAKVFFMPTFGTLIIILPFYIPITWRVS
jgi:hypothetical protein